MRRLGCTAATTIEETDLSPLFMYIHKHTQQGEPHPLVPVEPAATVATSTMATQGPGAYTITVAKVAISHFAPYFTK